MTDRDILTDYALQLASAWTDLDTDTATFFLALLAPIWEDAASDLDRLNLDVVTGGMDTECGEAASLCVRAIRDQIDNASPAQVESYLAHVTVALEVAA